MKSTFLEANVKLSKTFNLVNGEIQKIGHPNVIECTSHEVEWETLDEFAEILQEHAEQGHCLLKGNVTRPLINESRAGSTDPNAPTRLICFDVDRPPGIKTVDQFLDVVGFHDVDHIIQYSASMGIVNGELSAHVLMLCDPEKVPPILKQWLTGMNMNIPALRNGLRLTRTKNALHYPLDITTCQNDKLIYIAPPTLGTGVKDSFKGDRIRFIARKKRAISFEGIVIPTAEANKLMAERELNRLREAEGLPKRKSVTKTVGNVEYLSKPDQAVVTGIKRERGFVYFNLNDGDSWAYYHPENNPDIVYNFKGELPYLTKELIPDYWQEARKEQAEPKFDENGTAYLAFRDFRSATYWNGTWNRETNELNIAPARSGEQLKHFLRQHGQPVGDFFPDWTLEFDPHRNDIVDIEGRFVNRFRPTKYMLVEPKGLSRVPPTIHKILIHAFGDDEEVLEHYLNWLACIFQYRDKTMTAWVLHGIPGTGKGLLLNEILRPLFGRHVVSRRTRELESQFNGYMEEALIVWIDEAEIALQQNASLIEADLKNFIVEPMMSIRNMFMMPYESRSYVSVMLVSNKGEVITIDPNDRRYNVAPFQSRKLEITDEEIQRIREIEIDQFADYIATRTADRELARTPLNNVAKQRMIIVGQQAVDGVADAILSGNLQFLWDQRPTGDPLQISVAREMVTGAYMKLMRDIAEGKKTALTREELYVILEYNVGGMPVTPHKFAAFVKHHRLLLEPVLVDGRRVRGIDVSWQISEELKKEILG